MFRNFLIRLLVKFIEYRRKQLNHLYATKGKASPQFLRRNNEMDKLIMLHIWLTYKLDKKTSPIR